jgi:hypothetical protein
MTDIVIFEIIVRLDLSIDVHFVIVEFDMYQVKLVLSFYYH